MKKWMAFVTIFFISLVATAQYNAPIDRYFYDDNFDWRWDVRVRISDGQKSGYLTNNEAKRLYRILERIERKEWAFQADGYYSVGEQDEIWADVVDLNYRIGLELTDWDRRYYGYSGVVIQGRLPFYFGNTYNFNRFDSRGYGSITLGYAPRNYYPVTHVYYTQKNTYKNHWNGYDKNRIVTPRNTNYNDNSARKAEPRNIGNDNSRYNSSDRNVRVEDYNTNRSNSSRGESSRVSPRNDRSSGAREMNSTRNSSADRSSNARTGSPARETSRGRGL